MDHRVALKPNTPLRLRGGSGEALDCVIRRELGRGGTCIVYEAARRADTGDETLYRIKEFYPYALDIRRDEGGVLIPSARDAEAFRRGQELLRADFSRTNRLFYSDANYAAMTNQLDIFRQNGTSYILSAYSSQKTLATYQPETLKECVLLVCQAARVLDSLHRQGYLYLDIKPDNVLVVDGYPKKIQLFDFDSLVSMEACGPGRAGRRLAYSRGFAPVELRLGDWKRLGPHTDVYGVGALLFCLLFGRAPAAPDCEEGADFDFTQLRYPSERYDDRLFGALRVFFRKALAVYAADRYQSMPAALAQLQAIETFADLQVPRVYSTPIARPGVFFGRERELDRLDALLADPGCRCLVVSGMGGIGKSTLLRAYLSRRRERWDTILYVHYRGSTEATVSDDGAVAINTLRREEAEAGARYFDRKLQKLRALVHGSAAILVIDNFTGPVDADFPALLSTGLQVVLLGREAPACQGFPALRLSAVSDRAALRRIFEANLGRAVADEEETAFSQILEQVEGHTLVLELIAKQIASSHITVAEAAALTRAHGFSAIAPEQVDYEKDSLQTRDTVGHILDALFGVHALSPAQRALMKTASLLGDDGLDIRQFQDIMKLPSLDALNALVRDGWLVLSGDAISMHRVIQEAVRRWDWEPALLRAAEGFLTYFFLEIHLEATKNNYPKKLQGLIRAAEAKSGNEAARLREKLFARRGLLGMVARERFARADEEAPADIARLASLLAQAEEILRQCKREPALQAGEIHANLLYTTLLHAPRYQEDYILAEAGALLTGGEEDFVLKGASTLLEAVEGGRSAAVLRLYDLAVSIHAGRGRFDEAEKLLAQAERFARRVRRPRVYALYFDLLSGYYDQLLDGFYDTDDQKQLDLLNKLLGSIDKTLRYAKRRHALDGDHLYAKNLLAKATILLRSGRGTRVEIRSLMDAARKVILENTGPYADVRLHYYLVCAWYFALARGDASAADQAVQEALALSARILFTDLQKIEDVLSPCANIFYELRRYDRALDLLDRGLRLCAHHANTDSYARAKQVLCEHLWEVGIRGQQLARCQAVTARVEAENAEIVDHGNRVVIPEAVRRALAGETTEKEPGR